MSDINYLSHETFCMRSEIVDHNRELEWIIAGVSKFKKLSPYIITCKEFKLAPECKFSWEIEIGLYMESIVIKISRKDDLDQQVLLSHFIALRNSEGETYDPRLPSDIVIGNRATKLLLHCKLTEDLPLKLPNNELTVKIHLKLSNCCLITDETKKYPKLVTVSGENGIPRDLSHGCLLQSKYLDMQPSDVLLEVGDNLLPCHKFILSTRSTFFKKMSEDGALEVNSIVKFEDMDSEVCQGFKTYIYTNELNGISPDAFLELYNIAVKYQIEGLQDKCRSLILAESLNEKNVCKVLKLAELHNDMNLKTASTAFILKHIEKLKDSPEFSIFLKDDLLLFFQMLSNNCGGKK